MTFMSALADRLKQCRAEGEMPDDFELSVWRKRLDEQFHTAAIEERFVPAETGATE